LRDPGEGGPTLMAGGLAEFKSRARQLRDAQTSAVLEMIDSTLNLS
jgi:hypothetical protein